GNRIHRRIERPGRLRLQLPASAMGGAIHRSRYGEAALRRQLGILMISGKTTLIGHLGYPTEAFKAPMIYNPWFDSKGIDAAAAPWQRHWRQPARGAGAVTTAARRRRSRRRRGTASTTRGSSAGPGPATRPGATSSSTQRRGE